MKIYDVTIDVTSTMHLEVHAETREEAEEIAHRMAYEDTWSTDAIFGSSEIVDVEQTHNIDNDGNIEEYVDNE